MGVPMESPKDIQPAGEWFLLFEVALQLLPSLISCLLIGSSLLASESHFDLGIWELMLNQLPAGHHRTVGIYVDVIPGISCRKQTSQILAEAIPMLNC